MVKIPELAVSVPTRPIAFGADFNTSRMSETQMRNAARLPESDPSALEEPWQSEAMMLAQAPHVIAAQRGLGNFRSFGQGTLDAIGSLVSQDVFDVDTDIVTVLERASQWFSAFDAVTEAMQSVPFVGAAVRVIVSVAKVMRIALKNNVRLPPGLEMDPANDTAEVNRALRLIRSGEDWTPLFLPKEGPEHAEFGGWKTKQEDGGFRFGRGSGDQFGCAPGDLFFVARGVQARISTADVTIPSSSRKPPRSLILRTGKNPTTLRERVISIGEWYPSLAGLGRSVWSMMGAPDSAAMYQVDGYALIKGWGDYHHAAAAFKDGMDRWLGRKLSNGSKRWKREQIAAYLAHVGAAFHDVRNEDGSLLSEEDLLALVMDANRRPVAETVGMQAARAGSSLVIRQYAASKTRLNALVSKDAPALRANRELREHFLRERAAMRRGGRFDDIDLQEVPDEGLRSKLLARRRTQPGAPATSLGATGGMTLADAGTVETKRRERDLADLEAIPKPPPMTGFGLPTNSKPAPHRGFVLGAALVAATGLGGAALVAHRRERSRHGGRRP